MTPLLTLDAVNVRRWRGPRHVDVLVDASLDLEAGEFGGVWAHRAQGKTTLARVAAGLLVPDSGTIALDGRALTPDARRERWGALASLIGLAQRSGPELTEWTPAVWVASACSGDRWRTATRRAHAALDRVGATDVAQVPWEHLSDSERMLVAIAHAIVRGPKLLVVDDPIAGLAAVERDEVMQLLFSIARAGVSVLMTAAELRELQGVDRIWSLDGGRLEGPPARPVADVVDLHGASGRRAR